jgi:hypothetical protein
VKYFLDSDQKPDAEAVLGEQAAMYERAGMYKEALQTVRQQQNSVTNYSAQTEPRLLPHCRNSSIPSKSRSRLNYWRKKMT